MADQRPTRGLAEMIATVISPVLIMAMVGSLIFFLIEVLYGGKFTDNLRWTFFFYVLGAVLVARISIEMGDAKAALYAFGLGVAAYIGCARFVEYPDESAAAQFSWIINALLLVLVWWCARKLTWDCTFIDEDRDSSDRSLLEATGIDALERPAEWKEPEPEPEEELDPSLTWWERYRRYRKKQEKKPHTPGVWIVYFSLAALPIFGLGQALIPSEEEDSRSFTFWLMAIYVGSGLGLLMTTSFLGLRRYLKQRKVQIPVSMAGLWLGVGSGVILLFLTIAAVLPRPSSETALIRFEQVGSRDREASQFAPGNNSEGKGDGAPGQQSSQESQASSSVEGKSKEAGKGKGSEDSRQGSGKDKGKGGDSGKSKNGQQQKGDSSNDQKGDKGSDQKKNDSDEKNASENKKDEGSGRDKSQRSDGSKKRASDRKSGSRGSSSMPQLGKLGSVLKWIVFALLALAALYFVVRHGIKWLANFSDWARNLLAWWQSLFARRPTVNDGPMEQEEADDAPVGQPFAAFANPFDNGSAAGRSPSDLVKYSFAALEAFAREHERGRGDHETPIEFAARLARTSPPLERDAPRLAALYARLAYARGSLPEAARDHLREFWNQLELAHDEALQERRPLTAET